jgi:hypothetical protein
MDTMIAYCGLDCGQCPALEATLKDDDAERARVAEMWSKEFEVDLKAADINCRGCTADVEDDQLFSHCRVCEIRACSRDRGLINCAVCDDYGCEKLTAFHKMAPQAKETLDGIRADRTS